MKKILIFADTYTPGFMGGGPVVSISNLVDLIEDEFEILVCTRNHDFGQKTAYSGIENDVFTNVKHHQVIYLSTYNALSFVRVVRAFQPDFVYLNSFFSNTTQNVLWLNFLFWRKPLLVAPRGELLKNSLGIKRRKKSLYLCFFKILGLYKNLIFHSTDSIETRSLGEIFSIDKSEIIEIPNVPKRFQADAIRKDSNELRVVFISRICTKKNLHFALKTLANTTQAITFDIYGPLEDLTYWSKCQHIMKNLPKNVTVRYKGVLKGHDVFNTLRQYQVFLLPTLSENYGHIIVEAMQAGLIPVISDQTPWVNLQENNAGWDISLDNPGEYTTTLEMLANLDTEKFDQLSQAVIIYIDSYLESFNLRLAYTDFFNSIR
ncbi:MAG: glycosyltransferase family 4 protein [Porticoccaceae bacterium]